MKKQDDLPFVPGQLVRGAEVPDTRPLAVPLGYTAPLSLPELVALMTRQNLDRAGLVDMESFEESEDFDVDDGYDHTSPYDEAFDPSFIGARIGEVRAGIRGPSSPQAQAAARAKADADAKVVAAKAKADSLQSETLEAVREVTAELKKKRRRDFED